MKDVVRGHNGNIGCWVYVGLLVSPLNRVERLDLDYFSIICSDPLPLVFSFLF